MRVLTTSLAGWDDDTWLVGLAQSIRPTLVAYTTHDNGVVRPSAVACPTTRHVAVQRTRAPGGHTHETLIYPAFASGQPRYMGDEPTPIAGGVGFTHCDALDDLARQYESLTADIDGDRTAGLDVSLLSVRPSSSPSS